MEDPDFKDIFTKLIEVKHPFLLQYAKILTNFMRENFEELMYNRMGINTYKKGNNVFVDLDEYVKIVSDGNCPSSKILKNKEACNKKNLIILHLKNGKLTYSKDHKNVENIVPNRSNSYNKRKSNLIDIRDLPTVLDSIKRFTTGLDEKFDRMCIVSHFLNWEYSTLLTEATLILMNKRIQTERENNRKITDGLIRRIEELERRNE